MLSQVNIKIITDNQQDSAFLLFRYRGKQTIFVDTLSNHNGKIQYRNKYKLPEGIYLMTALNQFPIIEILIGKDQSFSLTINNLGDWNSIKVKGSLETANYFKLMAKMRRDDKFLDESLKVKHKDAFINLVINSLKSHTTMEDYWDDFTLDDERILTYPLIDNKLETYFNNLFPDAGTINDEIDRLIEKTGDCTAVRDYLIWYFYKKYYNSQLMNLEDVYIHIVDEYFLKLELEDVPEGVVNMMADRARTLEYLRIGERLHFIDEIPYVDAEFTTVFFYDKTCQICMQEGRILEQIQQRHPEMAIVPVEINSTKEENLIYLYDIQTTPTIYLLDNQKIIIAKHIKAEQVEQYLNKDRHE